ncbi:hypothetical protein CDAR_611691 [Caerostris darwini]|uniref:Uncharacterized protein n=1 Tax=Caerostris darwini TaxID=1538125 RepID=A0AAV4U2Q0_9ARAC|nr:hypothetical protein CDAR_611691 [Caerostris darwini]
MNFCKISKLVPDFHKGVFCKISKHWFPISTRVFSTRFQSTGSRFPQGCFLQDFKALVLYFHKVVFCKISKHWFPVSTRVFSARFQSTGSRFPQGCFL